MMNEEIMRQAMDEAHIASDEGNAPFGCVVVNSENKVILKEHDRVKQHMDPTAHGEINAIRELCQQFNTLFLENYTFYTTSEPCPLCMVAMIKAKVPKVYYGAKTELTASLPIPAETFAEYSAKHHIEVEGGIIADECLDQRTKLLSLAQD